MSDVLEQLKREYAAARDTKVACHDRLRDQALAEFFLKVGDKVMLRDKIGRVTRIIVNMENWRGKLDVELKPEVYPIKKNGQTATVGLMYAWNDDKIEILERDGQPYEGEQTGFRAGKTTL